MSCTTFVMIAIPTTTRRQVVTLSNTSPLQGASGRTQPVPPQEPICYTYQSPGILPRTVYHRIPFRTPLYQANRDCHLLFRAFSTEFHHDANDGCDAPHSRPVSLYCIITILPESYLHTTELFIPSRHHRSTARFP